MPNKLFNMNIFLVMIIFLLASCSTNPKELFSSYSDKYGKLLEYKIVYNVDSKGIQGGVNFNIKIGTFKKNKNEKDVIEIEVYGRSAAISIYKLDGRTIGCVPDQYSGSSQNVQYIGSLQNVQCFEDGSQEISVYKMFNDNAYLFTKIDAKDSEIAYGGTQELIKRKCDKFIIQIKNLGKFLGANNFDNLYQPSQYEGMPAIMEICLDKSTGLPLSTKISTKQKSELDDNGAATEFLTYTATSFSDKVDDSAFKLPENTCYSIQTKEQCESSNLACDWSGKTCGTKRFLPSKCLMQSGIACLDHKATSNSLTVVVSNSLGYDISIDAVKAQQCSALGSQGTLTNGKTMTFSLSCENGGSDYKGQFNITYTLLETGIQHTNQGQIITKLE